MKSNLKQVTAPSELPVDAAEMKTFLRIDNSLEDGLIETLIKTATSKLEHYLSIKFISQQWDIYFDSFGPVGKDDWWSGTRDGALNELSRCQNLNFPLGPVISLDNFNTYGDDDVAVPENVANYSVDKVGKQGRIGLKTGGIWPTTILRPNNGVQFRVTVGYGDKTKVPFDIVQAVKDYVAYMYENRGDKEATEIPPHVLQLVDSYKAYKLG